jgi:hypothetical protein
LAEAAKGRAQQSAYLLLFVAVARRVPAAGRGSKPLTQHGRAQLFRKGASRGIASVFLVEPG